MIKQDFSFKKIVEEANDIIIVTKSFPIDPPGPEIVYVNNAFTKLTGYLREEVIGKNPRILQTSETSVEAKNVIREALEKKEPVKVAINNYGKGGEEYWLDLSILPLKNADGEVTHFVAIERDITEQKAIQHKLEALSRVDPLTGLLNRRSFEEICMNEFSRYKRTSEKFSVLMIDIDHFKSINDNYGHITGDIALELFAELCSANIRAHDSMARMGGEEFCVILPCTKVNIAFNIAEKLRENIAKELIDINSKEIKMTISIGVSEVSHDDTHYSMVLERADKAMYQAKQNGRNCVFPKNVLANQKGSKGR